MVELYYIKGGQKQPFADVLQNSQENTYVGAIFLVKLHTCFPMIFVEFSRAPIF